MQRECAGARLRSIGAKDSENERQPAEYFESNGERRSSNGTSHHNDWSSAPYNAPNRPCRQPNTHNGNLGAGAVPTFKRITACSGCVYVDRGDGKIRARTDKSDCSATADWGDLPGPAGGSPSGGDAYGRLDVCVLG